MAGATVSVILPFHNAAPFLGEAVESVFAQTYDDWELLLVDDGAADGSSGIARSYAEQDSARVRYLQHEGGTNRGMSASRNLGLAQARGSHVAFLDGDDVWLETKLEEQLAMLAAAPEAAMVFGTIEWWHSWTGRSEDGARDRVTTLPVAGDGIVSGADLIAAVLRMSPATTTPSLVRRDAALQVGGFEEGFAGMYEDQAFFVKLCLEAPILATERCWYRWRKHAASCCEVAVATGTFPWLRRRYLDWVAHALRVRGVTDPGVWNALEDERAKLPPLAGAPEDTSGRRSLRPLRALRDRVGGPRASRARNDDTLPAPDPPVGRVDLGALRRTSPISRHWGYERGQPIDRYYIERFLADHADDIHGRVLEVTDSSYTRRYGGDRVSLADVLDIDPKNPQATFVADLAAADSIPSGIFDCVIVTQTLQLIFEVGAAIRELHRILRPGGVLLATVPGITQIRTDGLPGPWYWSFTASSVERLFGQVFEPGTLEVEAHGNVLAAVAFLHGLAAAELARDELNARDREYQVVITVRATKEREPRGRRSA